MLINCFFDILIFLLIKISSSRTYFSQINLYALFIPTQRIEEAKFSKNFQYINWI